MYPNVLRPHTNHFRRTIYEATLPAETFSNSKFMSMTKDTTIILKTIRKHRYAIYIYITVNDSATGPSVVKYLTEHGRIKLK